MPQLEDRIIEELAAELHRAERERTLLVQRLAAFFQRYDLLVTPTTSVVAPLARKPADAAPAVRSPFAATFSLGRHPAISIPCGLSSEGLPIGLQIAGRHFEEDLVLGAAWAFENTLGFNERAAFQR